LLIEPVPATSASAVVTPSLPALALASVPLVALLSVSVSPFCRPDSTPVPVKVSEVRPL
jgi:hypothetical protein